MIKCQKNSHIFFYLLQNIFVYSYLTDIFLSSQEQGLNNFKPIFVNFQTSKLLSCGEHWALCNILV